MTREERRASAIELMRQARSDVAKGDLLYDPVEVRRLDVQTAKKLRQAADLLDDQGRLKE